MKSIFLVLLIFVFTYLSADWAIVDIIEPIGVETGYLYGLDYHDGYLWVGDDSDGWIHQVDPADGAVLNSFMGAPDSNHGLTWDGEYFWVSGDYHADGNIYKMTADGTVVSTIPNPGDDYSGGLCWQEGFLWASVYYPNTQPNIHKLDPSDGTILESFSTVGLQPQGLVFQDANTLWNSMDDNDEDPERCTAYNYSTGDTLWSFPVPTTKPRGLAWDGEFLYLVAKEEGSWDQVIYKIDLSGSGNPEIQVGIEFYNFGNTILEEQAEFELAITNNGNADLEISDIGFTAAEFSCDLDFPYLISAGLTEYITIIFEPLNWGSYSCVMTIFSNDPLEPEIEIDLEGYGIFSDQTLISSEDFIDYGTVRLSSTNGHYLVLSNQGAEDLVIDEITISDLDFYLDPIPDLPIALATRDSHQVRIWFHPDTPGDYNAILEIHSNDPIHDPLNINLSGYAEFDEYPIGTILWEYIIDTSWDNSPKAMYPLQDINNDGISDLIVCSEDNFIRCLNGNSSGIADLLWEKEIYSGNVYSQKGLTLIQDIDGDEILDVIIGTTGGDRSIRALSGATGDFIWQHATSEYGDGGWVYQVFSKYDYNGDEFPDVLASTGDDSYDTGPKRIYCLDGINGETIWDYYFNGPAFSVIGVEDFTEDGIPDVIGGGSNEYETQGRVVGINGINGSYTWDFNSVGSSVWGLAQVDDVSGDSIKDIVAGDFSAYFYCLNIVNGGQIWNGAIGNYDIITRFELMDDVNNDGHPDILFENSSNLAVVLDGYNGVLAWHNNIGDNSLSVSRIPDITNDGINEALVGSLNNSAYFLNGPDGEILYSSNLGTAVDAITAIPDITLDNSWEMVAGGRNGLVRCLSGGTGLITPNDNYQIDPKTPVARLIRNYPNPFTLNGLSRSIGTRIEFIMNKPDRVDLTIYNLRGEKIITLVDEINMETGEHSILWDGLDSKGKVLPSGIYFYRLRTSEFSDTKKMILLK